MALGTPTLKLAVRPLLIGTQISLLGVVLGIGIGILLKDSGTATFEFQHLLNLISKNLFDTMYHEHFSYYSLFVFEKILEKNGLCIFDVEKLKTHGGSLRVYAALKKKSPEQYF